MDRLTTVIGRRETQQTQQTQLNVIKIDRLKVVYNCFLQFFPRSFSQQLTLPHSVKLPAVTHVLPFQTTYKMLSCRCIVAWAISAKKTIVYYSKAE